MGASRKLQGEIDRVLKKVQEGVDVFDSIWNKVYDTENANQKEKFEADLKKEIKKLQRYRDQIKTWIQSSEIKDKKVSASYEQALMDARKQIEREMERFKVCEKETKTKAFSKEGLGQQPKTDPKEKAKAETRDWLNNVVSDLESQIDNFEAEIEGLSIKKGKQRPPRLVHLEKSITRHKAHIKKLESILRLLDNDELSPEQVNDVKDFLEDYVERNQEDFDEFSDVEDLYSTLPMEKVEALEDMVSLAPSSLVKGVPSVSTSTVLSTKSSVTTSSTQACATQFRGRPEISADQREKYLQRLQHVQQQQGSLLNVSHITGINQKQFPTQQPNALVQQSSSIPSQVNLGLGVQGSDAGHIKSDEQQSLPEDTGVESAVTTGSNKQTSEDDTKIPYPNPSAPAAENTQLPRDTDLSPGQPLQPGMSSSGVGVIGRRSVSDLGAIGDNLTGSSANSGHDHLYNLQLLEAAFQRLPQPKDSERAKTYVPRHPAVTPNSYPQNQAPIVSNPTFWERIGSDTLATDMLFFAFYYQQNTYQQYLAARELKKQSWRFHRRYNTWFQRHVEPQVTTDEYERGSYVYFDFHVTEDGSGWCQRIKNDFTFEYNYLEDELSVQAN
nr:unnamed protein product [Digitaria exilis]